MVRKRVVDMVGILVPNGRERRLEREKANGEKWIWSRESDGWPFSEKEESGGVNMVAELP